MTRVRAVRAAAALPLLGALVLSGCAAGPGRASAERPGDTGSPDAPSAAANGRASAPPERDAPGSHEEQRRAGRDQTGRDQAGRGDRHRGERGGHDGAGGVEAHDGDQGVGHHASHEELEPPASTAGPLTRRTLPAPARLGPGWDYFVDPGDAEEGYLGNGTPALAREPAEVAQTVVPFGCRPPRDLPPMRHALEVDYTVSGVKVVTVRGTLDGPEVARAWLAARRTALEACRGRDGGPAIGRLVGPVDTVGAHAVRNERTPDSDPWTELALADGAEVVLVAVHAAGGQPPMTPDGTGHLIRAFRG